MGIFNDWRFNNLAPRIPCVKSQMIIRTCHDCVCGKMSTMALCRNELHFQKKHRTIRNVVHIYEEIPCRYMQLYKHLKKIQSQKCQTLNGSWFVFPKSELTRGAWLISSPNTAITWKILHLAHWGRDKTATIFQTTLSNALS